MDGQHRSLAILGTVGGAVESLHKQFDHDEIEKLIELRACPVITKFYDASPMRMRFGTPIRFQKLEADV